MTSNVLFTLLGFVLLFTRARWLGAPYFFFGSLYIATFYLISYDIIPNVSIPVAILGEYLHAQFYQKTLNDGISKLLVPLIWISVITYCVLGAELYMGFEFIYPWYGQIIEAINWVQAYLLITGGVCGCLYKDLFHSSPRIYNKKDVLRSLVGKARKC